LEEIAELLKSTREESGIEIEEVSKDLEINEILLKNIEEGKIGSFKDIFLLKNYISEYAKYLGLNSAKLLDEFNEYLFEYTSRIPIKEIEKTIELNTKESIDDSEKIVSPYTTNKTKAKKGIYILIYILVFVLVILTIFWSVNQITVDKKNAYVVSYRK